MAFLSVCRPGWVLFRLWAMKACEGRFCGFVALFAGLVRYGHGN
jgi:hypothetical protein